MHFKTVFYRQFSVLEINRYTFSKIPKISFTGIRCHIKNDFEGRDFCQSEKRANFCTFKIINWRLGLKSDFKKVPIHTKQMMPDLSRKWKIEEQCWILLWWWTTWISLFLSSSSQKSAKWLPMANIHLKDFCTFWQLCHCGWANQQDHALQYNSGVSVAWRDESAFLCQCQLLQAVATVLSAA